MDSYVSVSEAARIKKVTRQAIYLAIRLKRLKAYKHDDQWKVFLVDLQEYDSKRFSRIYHSSINGEPIFDEQNGYFSVDRASKMINIPKQKIYYAIRTGLLPAHRKRAAWVIHVSDLLEYQKKISKKDFTSKRA